MPKQLEIHVPVSLTAEQLAAEMGDTRPGWEYNYYSSTVVAAGLTLTYKLLSGTPTAPGPFTLDLVLLDDYGSEDGTLTVEMNVYEGTEPDPEPDPEPEPAPVGDLEERAMTLLGLDPEAPEDIATARESVNIITMMVRGYTRGRGFKTEFEAFGAAIAEDIQAVILTATVRYMANPSGLSYRAGNESVNNAFKGWSLAELSILNNYRKRWN